MENKLQNIRGDPIQEGLYPHPTEVFANPILYREQYLRRFSASIREEENWVEKITDRSFTANKLREIASLDGLRKGKRIHVWDKDDVDFVYQELIHKYKPYVEECKEIGIQPSIDGVWRIDDFADEKTRLDLIKAAATLENDPKKKWHPESNGQLLDLVHPSWWPIIYGRSKSINGATIEAPTFQDDEWWGDDIRYDVSRRFCWLPSEFEISSERKTTIASYINNLALPEQSEIFHPILENIFSKFVPLFNHILGDLRRRIDILERAKELNYKELKKSDFRKSVPEETYKKIWENLITQFETGETLTADIANELRMSRSLLRRFMNSTPFATQIHITNRGKLTKETWEPPSQEILEHVKLQGTTARVIVKMATIILTPDKPQWNGGPWHIEAVKNERIIATGIYYYDQDNITPSSLAFRRAVDRMRIYGRHSHAEYVGTHNITVEEGRPVAQELGSIPTKKNRAIVFPNIFQHRIEPFELVDKTKKGYRRILAFFLCDPSPGHEKIPTTKTVPPQQPDVQEAIVKMLCKTGAGKLPVELFQEVTKDMLPPISREEAENYKEELMHERVKFRENSPAVTGRTAVLFRCSD
ncbi:hypothetical protein TWF788_006611 [Orbilia oligospora]|uniref:Uncharacterized protein n=1 Tax=Orbilia oligospora TaxID=2813651 RepID=A0A7C8TU68_ORBOL|nr:hypothetical protein TWF788_006611 [Orbilia oligospora]